MSAGVTCVNCGSSELETEPSRGDTFCTKCGSVIEESCIVSEVQFEEGGHGGTHIVGQMVNNDSGFKGLSVGGILGSGRESRQVTLDNAKRRIKAVGAQLRLNKHCIDTAFNFYKMALSRRLTHGRKQSHVIAACIYITCRIEGTSHMLLDLSDVTQVNVYELGRTYLKLSSALCINIPAIDPCLYIVRFAHRLELGDKIQEVEMTALRIVQRMKRDWMHTGRRPSGLCGAALLVASRLNEIHCTIKDIIKIVKVCETTIRKRLNEFGDTPTSKLTLDEFMTIDLEGEEDPPCYKAARRKLKLQQQETQNQIEIDETEIAQLQELIEKDLEKNRKRLKGPYAKFARWATGDGDSGGKNIVDEEMTANDFITEQTVQTIEEVLRSDSNDLEPCYAEEFQSLRPTAASIGLTDYVDYCDANNREQGEPESNELDLTGIDDEELSAYILSPEEVVAKTNVWTKVHAEYLREMKEKEERKRQEQEREKESQCEVQPKKKRKSRKKIQTPASSASEAIEKMLQEKKISSKINYDVLKNLSMSVINGNPLSPTKQQQSLSDTRQATETPKTHFPPSSPIKRLTALRSYASNSPTLASLKAPIFTKLKANQVISKENSNKPPEAGDSAVLIQQSITSDNNNNKQEGKLPTTECVPEEYDEDYYMDEEEEEAGAKKELSVRQMLHHAEGDNELNDFDNYEDDDDCY